MYMIFIDLHDGHDVWPSMLDIGYRRQNIALTFFPFRSLLPVYHSYSRLTSKLKGLGFLGSPCGGGISVKGVIGKDR